MLNLNKPAKIKYLNKNPESPNIKDKVPRIQHKKNQLSYQEPRISELGWGKTIDWHQLWQESDVRIMW